MKELGGTSGMTCTTHASKSPEMPDNRGAQGYLTPSKLKHQRLGPGNLPVTSSLGEYYTLQSLWTITLVEALRSAGADTDLLPKIPPPGQVPSTIPSC